MFSDTILIFNKDEPVDDHGHEYLVMFACEFIQDLMQRTSELEIQFRAILAYNEFYYHKLTNLEAYYGSALVTAHHKEKDINALGLFIDKKINHRNKVFKVSEFDNDLYFVYLLQTLEALHFYGEFSLPLNPSLIESFEFYGLENDIKVLSLIHRNVEEQSNSKVRGKYLESYYQYKKRYSWLIDLFEANDFDHTMLSPQADWEHLKRTSL